METRLHRSLIGETAKARRSGRLAQIRPLGSLELGFRMGRLVPEPSSVTRGEIVDLFSDTRPRVRGRNPTLPGQFVFLFVAGFGWLILCLVYLH